MYICHSSTAENSCERILTITLYLTFIARPFSISRITYSKTYLYSQTLIKYATDSNAYLKT